MHLKDRFYWHIHIYLEDDRLCFCGCKGFPKVDLTSFLLNEHPLQGVSYEKHTDH